MSTHAATPGVRPVGGFGETVREVTGYWWVSLIAGIAWIAISASILQFDQASVATVGVLVGCLFAFASVQNLVFASAPREAIEDAGVSAAWRWVSALFAGMFFVAAVVTFVSPENTFAAMADTLGFFFLLVGLWWMVRAFLERPINPTWWLGLIGGILMTGLGFWTAGQFFIEKAYVLLVFAGIWALMEGISDIVRAFAIREVHKSV
jgi:uncharacterized membrane protein HdeD (DUF308 family)